MFAEDQEFDVIVIGAGHAGCEAALAAARMGCSTLLLTINLDNIAYMPCNPAVGGPAKGQVVREVDALGGEMGRITDHSCIQMRMLNTGKGPAVYALRAQVDKVAYQSAMKRVIEETANLSLYQTIIEELLIEDDRCVGVKTRTGSVIKGKNVILTTGTYLRGRIIMGDVSYEGGPNNQLSAINLGIQLQQLGFEMRRFKTGTPPRVNRRSVNMEQMVLQPGDDEVKTFSYATDPTNAEQMPCWLTHTNQQTHTVIRDNLHRAPMYSGQFEGRGPRYCPSIEDKIVRFADKEQHQIFVEPEGRNTLEMYVQGMSTSLPDDVQAKLLRTVPGLEKAEIVRTGYAIEYDVIMPTQLKNTLETKKISGLFAAGQINGTSGYEEAAGQGIIAGINAACKVKGREPVVLERSEAYIGVMIDDLVTKGTDEPYRLLTSRAEYRLLLRHDNADARLTHLGYQLGLVSQQRYDQFLLKQEMITAEIERFQTVKVKPTDELNEQLMQLGTVPITNTITLAQLIKRPELNYHELSSLVGLDKVTPEVAEQVEFHFKYEGYIKKCIDKIDKMGKMESKKIPDWIDYDTITSLSSEAREKLKQIQPASIGQAMRISGVNPSDISILMIYIKRGPQTVQA